MPWVYKKIILAGVWLLGVMVPVATTIAAIVIDIGIVIVSSTFTGKGAIQIPPPEHYWNLERQHLHLQEKKCNTDTSAREVLAPGETASTFTRKGAIQIPQPEQ